jgi:hypothetical protein
MNGNGCSCDSCGGELCPGDVRCGGCGNACDPDENRGFRIKRPVERGDTVVLDYQLVDPRTCLPPDLTVQGAKVWFTVKDYLGRHDLKALFQGVLGTGIENLGSGRVRVTIPATVTAGIPDGVVRIYYDLQVLTGTDGRVWTQEKGLFEVSPDVTRATS